MNDSTTRLNSLVSVLGIVCGFAQATGSAQAQAPIDPPTGRIVEVVANGSGCPAGTWDAEIGVDGLSATITFTGYKAAVDANRTFDTKNCQLALELASTEDHSYAISSVTFDGSATLAAGVSAELSTHAYISGAPDEGTRFTTNIDAPSAGFFGTAVVLGDETSDTLTWTSCGPAYDLNFNTRIVLRNAPNASGASSVDLSAQDGTSARIELQLIKRDC